jgi:hypothetical protein
MFRCAANSKCWAAGWTRSPSLTKLHAAFMFCAAAEAKRRTALHLAAQQGQLEIVKLVINTRRWAAGAGTGAGHALAAGGHVPAAMW